MKCDDGFCGQAAAYLVLAESAGDSLCRWYWVCEAHSASLKEFPVIGIGNVRFPISLKTVYSLPDLTAPSPEVALRPE